MRHIMKACGLLIAIVAIGAIGLVVAPSATSSAKVTSDGDPTLMQVQACGTTTWTLTAGQHINVGTVTVSNDAANLYIKYDLTYAGACFGELHAWAGNNLANLPGGGTKRPSPGQLCKVDGGACANASGATSYTFTIPFNQLNIVDVNQVCNAKLYVVTHAEVDLDCDPNTGGHETAFGGAQLGDGPAWWFYGEYNICCDFGPPTPPTCNTAFAKGSHIWTTDPKSNPEGLPSLKLTRSRWGWAINLMNTGVTTYDIWAGAGLNNTAKGVKVGTLTVNWDGSHVTVNYNLTTPGYTIEEVHLYAGDSAPTTLAPGQYGNLAELDPNGTSYTFSGIPLTDPNKDGVWLIAHAVVCK